MSLDFSGAESQELNMFEKLTSFAKENRLKTSAGAVASVVAIITGLWSIDGHYAKAEDLQKVEKKLEIGQQAMQLELNIQLNKQTQRALQMQIEDIEAKEDAKKSDAVDKARKQRLERQLKELRQETQTLSNQKFQLQAPK
jgi:hypothetical protein